MSMLPEGPPLFEPAQFVDDAMAVVGKTAVQNGVNLTMAKALDVGSVRTVAATATDALLNAVLALLDSKPTSLSVTLDAADCALGGGRMRACARVRLAAAGVTRTTAEELSGLLRQKAGCLPRRGTRTIGGSSHHPPTARCYSEAVRLIR